VGHDDEQRSGGAPTPDPPEVRDPLKQRVALSLAALVVLAAGLAILQVDASANESNTARETTRTAVQAMRANVVAATVAGLKPVLQAERDFLPFRRPLDVSEPSLAQAAGLAAPPTAGSLRVATQAVPSLGVDRVLASTELDANSLTLKQRALATTRITWNDRSTQYTTVIAVLAVALFLVGFALVTEGPIRRAAFGLGVGVGIFTAAWAVWIYFLPIPSTPDRAIETAALGAVATLGGDYRAAIGHYDDALAADGGYATAYAGRSRARLLAANPDYPVTRAVVDSSRAVFGEAVADAEHALQLNRRDILAASLLALTSFYDGEYDAAEDAVARALEINPKVPDLWLLDSAIKVGLGDRAGATASLDSALSLLRGAAPSQQTRLLAATYLSYLSWLERYDPAHAPLARTLTQRVVSTETAFTLGRERPQAPPAKGGVSVDRLRFANGKLTLRLRWHDLPAGTALSAIGYERPRPGGAWTQPPDLALFATVAGSGERSIAVPLTRACKPTAVRVDLYLNGTPTVSETGPGGPATC
jgi:tetratricopeptide (TPR) repeat protein